MKKKNMERSFRKREGKMRTEQDNFRILRRNELAAIIGINPKDMREDSDIYDLGAEDIDLLEFLIDVREKTGQDFSDTRAEKLRTVKEILDFVEEFSQAA